MAPGRFSLAKPHLAIGILAGIVGYLLAPASLGETVRAIIGWDTLALVYIAISLMTLTPAQNHEALKRRAAREDQSRWVILSIICLAAFASLIAIGTLLADTKNIAKPLLHLHLILGGLTVFASWGMVHLAFAIHYAHHFYGDADESPDNYEPRGGLAFPETPEPLFSDFLYYAFVIGMTCQVSDVQITGRQTRKLSTGHGILSFFFNTIILALSVNIAASLFS
jgi:uncharacterized membrane protein